MERLDHLVLATPDLLATSDLLARQLGVTPSPGGSHAGRGTRNLLARLGSRSYLEIIGIDEDQRDHLGPRPFRVDEIDTPTVVNWAVGVPDTRGARLNAVNAGYDPGPASAMQRIRPDGVVLSWLLTMPTSATTPFLIDWLGSTHPAEDAAAGITLISLRVRHPDPKTVSRQIRALGIAMTVEQGPEALLVTLSGPRGNLTFG
ncbi:VOC family protein [Nakamurella antarctica]|uniref:VOC family protein n=2 Tax=Nakamurella antarctica TaxID=1902245 RepID=A0A3G8ZQG9_9ACTN|nr:VOC family protein [Nakamurella antarctica]